MFTGIVETTGLVGSVTERPSGVRLHVLAPHWAARPAPGDSIAVNGCCLTHAPGEDTPPGGLAFDVIPETLRRTTLGSFAPGTRVNLEAALTATKPMGGHFVQGHIDAVGEVRAVAAGADWRLTVGFEPGLRELVVPKGSITVDGVSLTLASVDADRGEFEVALIPTTLEVTQLGSLRVGDRVNLETDMIVRTVVQCLRWREEATRVVDPARGEGRRPERSDGVTMSLLREAGF